MIVVDSSAWIDLFRERRTAVASALERLIEAEADLAVTETVLMEVLAGASSADTFARVRAELISRPILRLEGVVDFEEAARIYRVCRAAGQTLRSHLDCLVAVPTIRHGASLLQNDRDFETIARHTTLKLEPLRAEPELSETARSYGRPRRARPSATGAHRARPRVQRSAARA
ncbi:MAG: PIN domain nuclease [Chloroflexi bacterium]|nr:PIN domain nuclease [Chloroflexota bacterium]